MGGRSAGERRVLPREHQDPHRPHATRGTLDRPEPARLRCAATDPQGGTHAHSGQGLVIPHGSCRARRRRHRRGHHRPARHRASRHGARRHRGPGRHGTGRHRAAPRPRPDRGDADLVIWADDTRDAGDRVRSPSRSPRRTASSIAVQELPFGDIRDQLHADRAQRRRARTSSSAPTTGSASWSPTASSSRSTSSGVADGFDPVAIEAFTYDGQTYGAALRHREHRPRPQHRPRARGAGDVRGDDADRHRLQGRARRRPVVPGSRPADRPGGRRLPPTSRSCRRSAATSSARTRTARTTPTTSASTPRAAWPPRRGCRSRPPPACSAPTSRTT